MSNRITSEHAAHAAIAARAAALQVERARWAAVLAPKPVQTNSKGA